MAGRRIVAALVALVTTVALAAGVSLGAGAGPAGAVDCTSSGTTTVTTDKSDYSPGDIVHITGTGYACGTTVTVQVVPPAPGTAWTSDVAVGDDGTISADYPIPVGNNLGIYDLSVVDDSGQVLAAMTFMDSHFRYGTLSWTRPDLASRTVTFTVQAAFRLDYFTSACGFGPVSVGTYIPPSANSQCIIGSVDFGDSTVPQFFGIHVTSIDTANDILQGFDTLTHTYAGTGTNFVARWTNCCRVSTLLNNHDAPWNVQTQVNLNATSGATQSPTSVLPAMTDCAVGSVCTIPIPASDTDPNGATLAYRLATPLEMGDASEVQPPGAVVNSATGVFTWNSAGHGTAGALWNAVVMIEARNSAGAILSTVEVDFLIRLVSDIPPVFVSPPSPTNGSIITANVGDELTIPLEARSPAGHPVTIHSLSTLSGATLSCPAAATPIDCTYTWTPTLTDTGSHLIAFQAEDSLGATSSALNVTINVPQVVVTVTPDNQSIIYGNPDPAFTYQVSGLLGSDELTTQPTCGVAGPHSAAGSYLISCAGAVAPTGYTVEYNVATLAVGQAMVDIIPDDQNITYGDPEPTFTYQVSGLAGSDTLITQPTCGVSGPHAAAGLYVIKCSGADAGPNYAVHYDAATLTVARKALTISADNQSISYGDPEPTFTYQVSGLVVGDSLTTPATCGVSGPHTDVGTYDITCAGADAGPNYTIGYQPGTLTISAKHIVVTPDDQTITYGDAEPAFTFTHTPFDGTDGFTTSPTCGVAGPHSDAGTYTITCSGGDADGNYVIDYATGTLTVNPARLVVTADNQSTGYGRPEPAFTFSVTGFVGTDGWITEPTCSVAGPHADAGTYPITCSGGDAGTNYAIDYEPGTLTVSQATVTITPDNQTKFPNQPDPTFTFSTAGLVDGDQLLVPPTCGVAGPHDAPGTYPITCSGADAGPNYTIDYGTATLTVAKATPSLNTSPSASVPVGGLISDTATLVGGADPTGSVTFTLYAPGDTTCAHAEVARTVQLVDGVAHSGTVQATQSGTYNWVASYSGDDSNNPVAGTCGDEPVVVTSQVLTGRAYGLSAAASLAGVPLLEVRPTPDTGAVDVAGSTTVAPGCVLAIPGIASVDAACAAVTTSNAFPARSTAGASIAAATIGVPGIPAIVVRAIESTSSTTCGGSVGTVTIAYLKVGTITVISKPTPIKPNTTINVGVVKLVLNEQTPISSPDQGLQVNALHATVNVLGLARVDVVLASAESDIGNCP